MVRRKQPFQMCQLVCCPQATSSLCRNAILHSIISRTATVRQEDLTRDSKRSNEQKPQLLLSENKFKTMLGSQPPVYFIRSLFQRYLLEIISLDSPVTKSHQNQCQKKLYLLLIHLSYRGLTMRYHQWVCGQTEFNKEINKRKTVCSFIVALLFTSN